MILSALQLRYNVSWTKSMRRNPAFVHYIAAFATFAVNTTLTANLTYTVRSLRTTRTIRL